MATTVHPIGGQSINTGSNQQPNNPTIVQQQRLPEDVVQQQQQQQQQQQHQQHSQHHQTHQAHYHHHPSLTISGSPPMIPGPNSPQDKQFELPYTIGHNPGLCALILTVISVILIVLTLPFSLFFCIKVVQEYERAVIFRLGRLVKGGAKGPGIFFIIPCIDTYSKVDLRTVSFDVPPQEILSKDSVTVAVDAVVYYRISNATIAVSNVEDYGRSTRLLAATTLRNVLGTKNLSEILSERESISHIMQSSLDEATDPWGVKVERVEIKDARLPVQLQRAMATEAEAAREARAKVIAAEGEQRASRALKEAADVIHGSPAALQLRYLQTLNSIAAEKNSTIVFPLPIDLFRGFLSNDHAWDEPSESNQHHQSHEDVNQHNKHASSQRRRNPSSHHHPNNRSTMPNGLLKGQNVVNSINNNDNNDGNNNGNQVTNDVNKEPLPSISQPSSTPSQSNNQVHPYPSSSIQTDLQKSESTE
ncbi:band 7 protein AGAP004871-like isoform X1 [Tetranychus urticae]|uniref:band 7 protein AGAP004871-like isoform X1 n=1 Tax=Tetranychus urticae TaxID=32264 RepID=UPI00077BB8C9|nr:band 7 protein AGAP004871-like isoform X1 [Tetranychus urticae]